MNTTTYPTIEEALFLHQELISRFGGPESGVRDKGLLESALHRPKSGYYETLSAQAAALLHSLALNHCFLDGNKRVSFALTAIFLRMNGWRLAVTADEGERFMLKDVIEGKADVNRISEWIETRLVRI